MTLIVRDAARNRAIARRFGAKAEDYDSHAGLQRETAARLAGLLPALGAPRVLEVGCGTGFLTAHLLDAYRDGDFLITDLAPEMLDVCRERQGRRACPRARFALMDGEAPESGERFDLIALNMTLQWFADPVGALERLRSLLNPGGTLCYATLGPGGFPEWRAALAAEGLPEGIVAMPPLPGVVTEENKAIPYGNGSTFLAGMKSIGAGEPRSGYRPLTPGQLRRALRRLEREHGARVTWHLVYGRLAAYL